MIYLCVAGLLLCICASGYFSASEMAYSSCNRLRLENLRDAGDRRAALAVKICDRFDDALSAILIGNNLANIAASSLGSVLVILIAGDDSYAWVATVVITVLIIIFGETIPKITTKNTASRKALTHARPIRFLMIVLSPVIKLVVGLIRLLTGWLKGETVDADGDEASMELSSIIETAEGESVLDEEQSELVQAAIDFGDIMAYEVMTARVDVIALDIDDSPAEQLALIDSAPYSRIPVYEDGIDNVIGVLYLNHFLKALTEDGAPGIRDMLMPPCYVYKTMKLPAILGALRRAKQHLAIVTDEYGGTLGVVSMEDVLEQLVGDIWDDTDEVEREIVKLAEGQYELDGDVVIGDFLELVGIPERDFEAESETVGGWTIEMFGAFPKVGDEFTYGELRVKVIAMDDRRVERVLVRF